MVRLERRMWRRRAMSGRRKARQSLAESGRRNHDAVKVFLLGGLGWPLHSNQLQGTDLWDNEQKAREHIGPNPRLAAVGLPIVCGRESCYILLKLDSLWRIRLRRLAVAMQKGEGVGNARNESTNREAVAADVEALAASAGEASVRP